MSGSVIISVQSIPPNTYPCTWGFPATCGLPPARWLVRRVNDDTDTAIASYACDKCLRKMFVMYDTNVGLPCFTCRNDDGLIPSDDFPGHSTACPDCSDNSI